MSETYNLGDPHCAHDWDNKPWQFQFQRTCRKCGKVWVDPEHYVIRLTHHMEVKNVIDLGCGFKGFMADHYWRMWKGVKEGYAIDIWKLPEKYAGAPWTPIVMDALDLDKRFSPKSIDVITGFGFMEHLKKPDGFKMLDMLEGIAKKIVIVSAATCVHGGARDYKVKKNGNPYHYYWSTWSPEEFEKLGYETNKKDVEAKICVQDDVVAWKRLR